MKVHFLCGAALFGLLGLQTASASLILQTYQTVMGGTGIGAVSTVLTFQNNGTETGCIGQNSTTGSTFGANGACTGTGDTKTGASQTQLQPLSSAGITTGAAGAAQFELIFNANQPAGGSLAVTNVTASFYNSTGATLLYQTSGLLCQTSAGGTPTAAGSAGCLLSNTAQGTGNSGFAIVLNSAQQAAAVTAGAFSSAGNLVGLSAAAGTTAAPSAGGNETIFLANSGSTTPVPPAGGGVPEPGTCLLLASGLGLVGLTKKFRKA